MMYRTGTYEVRKVPLLRNRKKVIGQSDRKTYFVVHHGKNPLLKKVDSSTVVLHAFRSRLVFFLWLEAWELTESNTPEDTRLRNCSTR